MKFLDWLENKWFLWFSRSTLDTQKLQVRDVVAIVMLIPFMFGFVFTILGLQDLVRIFIFIELGMLVPFALVWIFVFFYHNWKIKKLNNKWQ